MNIHLRSTIAVLAMMVIANAASAQTKLFEKNYVRGKGAPEWIVETFTIHNPDGEFSVLVQNGEGKRGKVSNAVINLNGQLIVGPNAFNKQVDSLTKPVTLKKENELAVEVRSQPGTSVSISILGPDLPTPSPVSGVTVVPNAFPTNSPTQVTFTSAIPYSPTGPTPSVQLERVTDEGEFISLEGSMVDNGQLSLGDEIFGDGVFSFRKNFSMSEPSKVYLRVKTDINGSVSYSEIFSLTAFTPLLDTDAATIEEVLTSGRKLYYELLPEKGHDQAAAEAVTLIKAYSLVQDAGVVESGRTIWVEFTNGVSGVIPISAPGTRGGGLTTSLSMAASSGATTAPTGTSNIAVNSKRVLILSPFYDEFTAKTPSDEGPVLKSLYENHNQATPCPLYDIVYLENSQVGVESFKAFGEYGIIHVASHGAVTANGDVYIGTKPRGRQIRKNIKLILLQRD